MLNKLYNIWNDYGYTIVIVGSIIIILGLAIFRIGKKGSWSDSYIYDPFKTKPKPEFTGQGRTKESSGERECRRVLQDIFKKPFNSSRPDFLKNPVTGNNFNLELDCYEPSLRLACEYNGQQHYKYVPYFHKNKEAFYNQKYRDELKERMCRDNNIHLISVPHTVKVNNIEEYIVRNLKIIGYVFD